MADRELQSFLDAERSVGELIDTGSFSVDFQTAMAKRASFALPKPGLWAVRTMQGLIRLGASSVAITQTRKQLIFSAPLHGDIDPETPLAQLFRCYNEADPRYPLHAGLLAALGRDYEVKLRWPEGPTLKSMRLSIADSTLGELTEPVLTPSVEVQVTPPSKGLFSRFFAVADFSSEFRELQSSAFLAPIPVTIDSRPYDLRSGFAARFFPSLEFRGVRATTGPRLPLPPLVISELAETGFRSDPAYQPLYGEGDGYAFILSLGWPGHTVRRSTAAWVQDGVVIDEEPLFSIESPLALTLFLPADGLTTDATGFALRLSQERTARLQEARLWAITSLKTSPPPLPFPEDDVTAAKQRQKMETAIESLMQEALKDCEYTASDIRKFKNAISSHLKKAKADQALVGERGILVKGALSEEEQRVNQSLNRWGSFLSYTPPPAEEDIYVRFASKPPPPKFFGDVYRELPPPNRP